MIRFFENLPKKVLLEIVAKTTRQDQARLSQVNKFFNQFFSDNDSELLRYKATHRWYKINDKTCLMVYKLEYGSYALTLFNSEVNQLKELFLFEKETTDKISAALELGYPKLIESLFDVLNPMGSKCTEFAKILHEESQKVDNQQKLDPNRQSECIRKESLASNEQNSVDEQVLAESYSLMLQAENDKDFESFESLEIYSEMYPFRTTWN